MYFDELMKLHPDNISNNDSIKDFLNKRLRNAQYILNLSDKPEDIYKQE